MEHLKESGTFYGGGGLGGGSTAYFFVTKKAYHKEKRPLNRKHAPSEEKKFRHEDKAPHKEK